MKISIITPSFNSEKTIEKTIQSVISQTYQNLEYIIIDGGSKDRTLKIVEKYKEKIAKIFSGPDEGLYDAMNKGIEWATGEVVGILNSDDFYPHSNVLEKVVEAFLESGSQAVYGDVAFFKGDNYSKIIRFWRAGEFKEKKLNWGWAPPHPAFFLKKEVYQKYGLFRLDFKIAADYELMLRLFKIHKISVFYLPEVLVYMRQGGESSRNLWQRIKGWKELRKAWRVNNLQTPKFFILRRVLSKIGQYRLI